jgi:hypothetical protein
MGNFLPLSIEIYGALTPANWRLRFAQYSGTNNRITYSATNPVTGNYPGAAPTSLEIFTGDVITQIASVTVNGTTLIQDTSPQNVPGVRGFIIINKTSSSLNVNGNPNFNVPGNTTCVLVLALGVVCMHGDTMVQTTGGFYKIMDLASTIDGREIKLVDQYNQLQNLKFVAKFGHSGKFVCISKDSIAENVPNADVFITPGHPVLVNGEEIIANNLVNGTTIYLCNKETSHVYSPCTKERIFLMMNNLPVCTWSEVDFQIHVENKGITHVKQF